MAAAKFGDDRQQKKYGVLIGADGDLAVVKITHLDQGSLGRVPQIQHLAGVIEQDLAGEGERTVLGRAVKKALTDLGLEPSDGLADRRLSAVEHLGGPRKTALARDRYQNLKLIDIHNPVRGTRTAETRPLALR